MQLDLYTLVKDTLEIQLSIRTRRKGDLSDFEGGRLLVSGSLSKYFYIFPTNHKTRVYR